MQSTISFNMIVWEKKTYNLWNKCKTKYV